MLPMHRLMACQRRPLVEVLLLSHHQPTLRLTSATPYVLSRSFLISTYQSLSTHHSPSLVVFSSSNSSRSLLSSAVFRRSFASSASSSYSSTSKQQKPDSEQQQQQQQQQQSHHDEHKQQREQDNNNQQGEDPYADEPQEDRRSMLARIGRIVGITFLLGGSFFAGFHFSSRGAKVHSERVTPRSYVEVFTDIYDGMHDWVTDTLGTANTPLLPPPTLDMFNRKPRTLVVGLEDTLTHHDWDRYTSHQLQQRPHLQELLEGAARHGWEVVLFSSKPQIEVEPDLMAIDTKGFIRHRLFYDQTNMRDWHLIKDLTRLGRERTRVLVVDWNKGMYKGWEDNVLTVRRWKGPREVDGGAEGAEGAEVVVGGKGMADRELREVLKVLEKVQRYNVYDVRRVVARKEAGEKDLFAEEEELAEQARRGLQERQNKQQKGVRQREREEVAASGDSKSRGGWLSALGSLFTRAGTGGKKLASAGASDDE